MKPVPILAWEIGCLNCPTPAGEGAGLWHIQEPLQSEGFTQREGSRAAISHGEEDKPLPATGMREVLFCVSTHLETWELTWQQLLHVFPVSYSSHSLPLSFFLPFLPSPSLPSPSLPSPSLLSSLPSSPSVPYLLPLSLSPSLPLSSSFLSLCSSSPSLPHPCQERYSTECGSAGAAWPSLPVDAPPDSRLLSLSHGTKKEDVGCEGGGRRGGRTPGCQTNKNCTVRRSKQDKHHENKIIGVHYVLCFSTSICEAVCSIVFQSHLLIAGSTHAIQHVLNTVGYESSKSVGSKPGDQGPVAMEMEPEDVQWLKVRMDLPCSLLHSHLSPFPSFSSSTCFFPSSRSLCLFLFPFSFPSFSSLPSLPFSPAACLFCFLFLHLLFSVLPLPPFSKSHTTSLVPRLSPRANTASNRKLGGAWEQGSLNVVKSLIPRLAWSLGITLAMWGLRYLFCIACCWQDNWAWPQQWPQVTWWSQDHKGKTNITCFSKW